MNIYIFIIQMMPTMMILIPTMTMELVDRRYRYRNYHNQVGNTRKKQYDTDLI